MIERAEARRVGHGPEEAVARRWASGPRGPVRLADGRLLRVIFPGVPGGGSGPDFRDATLDAGGDYLRGDVEVHTLASGWKAHGHHRDPAYGRVVLHVVGRNDSGQVTTTHANSRAIPILVLDAKRAEDGLPAAFVPPCALRAARGDEVTATLARMGMRRLRMKSIRCAPTVRSAGPGQALYALAMEALGGSSNREPFAEVSGRLPLAALVERAAAGSKRPEDRAFAMTAELRGVAMGLPLVRTGFRPAADPARRLEAAGRLFARLWPEGTSEPGWPATLAAEAALPGVLLLEGIGRGMAVELAVNAVLPVAHAAGAWSEGEVERCLQRLPSPGTYGRLRELEGWLGGHGVFRGAATLQGGLLLHGEYCTQGQCGRCPLSS